MLRTLLESKAPTTRRTGGTLVSVGIHTAAIALAVTATARATIHRDPVEKPTVITVLPPPPPNAEHRTHVERPPSRQHCCVEIPYPVTVVIPPVSTPDHLPPIDFGKRASPDDFCVDCARRGLLDDSKGAAALSSPGDPYTVTTVEKAAMPRPDNPAPVYPPALRAVQIEGSVIARFIVDTTGRAEPASIAIVQATQEQFGDAVRQSLLRSRYLPAMIGERKVRQLVEQRFAFSLVR